MAREFTHQVTARDPHRQAQALLGGGLGHGQRDAVQVRVRVVEIDAVGNHGRKSKGMGKVSERQTRVQAINCPPPR